MKSFVFAALVAVLCLTLQASAYNLDEEWQKCFGNRQPLWKCKCSDGYDPVRATNGCTYNSPCLARCYNAVPLPKKKGQFDYPIEDFA